jgi:diacylglycerol kinase (ATP)
MAESPSGAASVRRLLSAARNSAEGLRYALTESAFRLEAFLAAILVPLALYLGRTGVERALLAGSVLLVLIIELANSAMEAAVDRISLERHPLAKRAKDIGSAAVMLALVNVAVVWLLVLL